MSNPAPGRAVYEIAREEASVAAARRSAERAVAGTDAACREAVAMAVQEFGENLAKYSMSDGTAGTIALLTSERGVVIRVRSFACSPEDATRVKQMVRDIETAPSVAELYRVRQSELFENPLLPRARLGLLRVAFEGGFRLSCSYEHPVLEILAERP